jgi:hypothetical protein
MSSQYLSGNKGVNMIEFLLTSRGLSWFSWILDTMKDDGNAFYGHPLFKEIIHEFECSDE